uniref:Uncharacterized protein n=1 Tax=Rhizophora mucronata TaxID=61149 RepID=A0A2P2P9A6_RHIMU
MNPYSHLFNLMLPDTITMKIKCMKNHMKTAIIKNTN